LLGRDALQLLPADYKPDAVLVKPSSLLLVHQALHVISRSMKGLPIRDIDKAQTTAILPAVDKDRTENVRLWVVDDQIINRLVVQQLLSSYGYAADLLESGREAVELLGEGEAQVDLILMDLHMPEMDGIEATALIRRRHSSDKLPIIALTADVTMEMHMRCKEAGMNDIITKPIEPDILLEVIGRWIPSRPSVPAVRPVETEQWPDLPGLRPAAALQRLNGKGELYLKLLHKFSQEYSDVRQRLAALLRQGDRKDAVRLVHSLRGAAGHLGAVVIQEAAATMERMLQSDAPVEEYEQEFYHYLEEGMDSIATLLRRKRS
jgi:CheY-like chemotaxis protein/HPt (histidine-containing phosphotransfer) domain-containing protein